jgi:hypothetical protein
VGRSHPHAGKARAQLRVGALAPQGLLAVGMSCGKFIQVYASRRCCPARSLCSTLCLTMFPIQGCSVLISV